MDFISIERSRIGAQQGELIEKLMTVFEKLADDRDLFFDGFLNEELLLLIE